MDNCNLIKREVVDGKEVKNYGLQSGWSDGTLASVNDTTRMRTAKELIENSDTTYLAQKALLAKLDKGELRLDELQARTRELFEAEVTKLS
jgi:hypothetical protein